jgi:hypothetical protein
MYPERYLGTFVANLDRSHRFVEVKRSVATKNAREAIVVHAVISSRGERTAKRE